MVMLSLMKLLVFNSFNQTFESVRCSPALGIAKAIKGTSMESHYKGFAFDSLLSRRWFRM